MFKIHHPASIYERLPLIYLLTAIALAIVPLSPVKWVAVVSLVLAAWVTRERRRTYRSTQRLLEVRRRVGEELSNVVFSGSSGGFLDSVYEWDSVDDVSHELGAVECAPLSLG